MVRSYNKRSKKNALLQEAGDIRKEAEALLEEQLNEDTPEANKEDIVRLLFRLAVYVEKITSTTVSDIKGGTK